MKLAGRFVPLSWTCRSTAPVPVAEVSVATIVLR